MRRVPQTPYFFRVLIAIDACIQAFFRRGVPGVTISSRAATARARGHRWGCVLCRFLDWLDPGHCAKAIRSDRRRARAALKELKGY